MNCKIWKICSWISSWVGKQCYELKKLS